MAHQLKDLLSGALSRNGISSPIKATDVVSAANSAIVELFGAGFERRARAVQFKAGEVVVEVNSAVVASEMRFQETELLRKLQKTEQAVERVAVRVTSF